MAAPGRDRGFVREAHSDDNVLNQRRTLTISIAFWCIVIAKKALENLW